jgi:hypothetical protein
MLSVSTSGFAMGDRMASLLDRIHKNIRQNHNNFGSRYLNISYINTRRKAGTEKSQIESLPKTVRKNVCNQLQQTRNLCSSRKKPVYTPKKQIRYSCRNLGSMQEATANTILAVSPPQTFNNVSKRIRRISLGLPPPRRKRNSKP